MGDTTPEVAAGAALVDNDDAALSPEDDGWAPPPEAEAAIAEMIAKAAAETELDGPWREAPPGPRLAESLAVLDPAGVGDPSQLSDYDLVEYVKACERQRRHVDGLLATALAALARRPVFEECAEPDDMCGKRVHGPQGHDPLGAAADEVAPAMVWTTGHAASQVEGAVELAEQLPATLAMLRAGRIDAYKARIIRQHTFPLENQPTLRAQVEAAALRVAEGKTAPALRAFVTRAVMAADPQAAKQRHRQATSSRGVTKPTPTRDGEDGMASMGIYGPVQSLAAFWTAVDAAARARRDAADQDPDHPDADKLADEVRFDVISDLGFGALALGHLGCCHPDCTTATITTTSGTDTGPETASTSAGSTGSGAGAGTDQPLGSQHGVRAHIVVRMNATTAAGADDLPAELEGFGPITADTARQLAADATWRRLLTDPVSGQLLDYGRTTYQPPQALRDFLIARDVTCRFPGCSWPARSSDLDHQPAWADGGETKPDGMISLHRRHHNGKTLHGHRIDEAEDGTWHWVTPTGHRYTIHPTIIDTIRLLDEDCGEPDQQGSDEPQGNQDPPDNNDSPPF